MTTAAIVMLITNDVLIYVTLPVHARLLYVLLKPSSKKDLDASFHLLMLNSTIVNLIFALVSCFILEPSWSGVFFEFYEPMGPYFAKIESIKGTVLGTLTSALHVVLAMNRFSAIAFPLRHNAWWSGRRLFWFCVVMWAAAFCFSIPLMLPGSTFSFTVKVNVYGVSSVEFAFQGNYYTIYSMGGGFSSMGLEIISLLFYIGLLIKFIDYSKIATSGAADMKRMRRGVLRMTLSAFVISLGNWFLVAFGLMIYISIWTTGIFLFSDLYFTAIIRLLNAINNVVTPWVMLIAFNNIRYLVFGRSKACQTRSTMTGTHSSGGLTKF